MRTSRPTKTLIGQKARKAILDGVNAIAIPVGMSLGPQGKNALLYRTFNRGSRITNDGYTIGEVQEPKDVSVALAARAFKEMCKRTNEKVGDGTTTTAIIGGKLMNDVYNLLTEGSSEFTAKKTKIGVMTLKKKILESAEKVKAEIKKVAIPIKTLEDLEKIAIVSVEDKELGKIIAKMAWETGIDGFIDVVEGYKGTVETEVIKGMRFPAKIAAKAFVNNPQRFEMVALDCPVVLTNYSLDNAADFSQTFQKLNAFTSKVIVMAPSFSENVLVNMVNATKSGYFFFPVLVPSLRTEQFEDLAIYCGATFIDKNKGRNLRTIGQHDLGFLQKLIIKDTEAKEDAVATGGKGTLEEMKSKKEDGKEVLYQTSTIKERIETLKGQLAETRQEQFKKLLERRIASMASAIGIIRVGDSTEASSLYRKLKIEDAVYACKAALRGGYVKGGGICLRDIAIHLQDDDILKMALLEPYKQIQSSFEGGLDISEDIIDPAEAVYYEVEHATQIVANLATVEVITEEIEDVQPGDGYMAMARMLGELSIAMRRHLGLLRENEEEVERDRLKGLTLDETVYFDGQNLL